MKIKLALLFIICIVGISLSQKEKSNDQIIGEFYCNIYSYSYLNKELILVKEIPAEFDSIYKPEYDVGWKLNFQENGRIKVERLFLYYCGFEVVILENGKWKKLKNGNYKICFTGISYDKSFKKKSIYECIKLENGNLKLIPKND